jgi:hypothetical protein
MVLDSKETKNSKNELEAYLERDIERMVGV